MYGRLIPHMLLASLHRAVMNELKVLHFKVLHLKVPRSELVGI